MDVSKFFNSTSRYLRASDINGPRTLRVAGWSVEKLNGREKFLLHFRELQKALVVNRENSNRLRKLFGSDADNFVGKNLTLYMDGSVEGPNGARGGIRIAVDAAAAGEEPAGADALGQEVKTEEGR